MGAYHSSFPLHDDSGDCVSLHTHLPFLCSPLPSSPFFLLLFLRYLEEVIPQSTLPNLSVTSSKLWSEPTYTVPDGLLEIATISR